MITLFRAPTIIRLNDLKEQMRQHIRQLPQQISCVGTPTKILRFELPCEPVEILAWLHNNQLGLESLYWSDREGAFEVGGIGICEQIRGDGPVDHQEIFGFMEERLSPDNPHLRFYGGLNFYTENLAQDWGTFGTFRFSVPQFEMNRHGDQYVFAFNLGAGQADEAEVARILKTLDQINFEPATQYRKVPQVVARRDCPEQGQWQEMFDALKDEKGALKFEKIVLARKTIFDFDTDLRPMALLKHLKDMSPHCFHFCIQPAAHEGFVGASPERLFKRVDKDIQTEAIAGTAKRGETLQEDTRLADELLNSTKNQHEHRFVVNDLKNKLGALCEELTREEGSSLLKLDNGQHLITRFEGVLMKRASDDQILNLMHPTPAVAGTPTIPALEAITKLEPFDRGWYAAPVGYVGYDQVEFVVAIRSGLIKDHQLSLYAGAGIVLGSTAQGEWDEIENKIGSFLKVFNK